MIQNERKRIFNQLVNAVEIKYGKAKAVCKSVEDFSKAVREVPENSVIIFDESRGSPFNQENDK